ncbi:MAE_28990/MAE_18760 family HEPN-like nuclease [Enterobacter asburiae]|uniref:MAE_28990/MAE_18760 family HEPN-like nuclease n=1 Tax=Enterobacter asburiae TaxID=61645 RepID=UPI0038151CDE
MAIHLHRASAKLEAQQAHDRHIEILTSVKNRCVDNNQAKDGFLYLMAVPVIYAAWEGYFKISCSICLRRYCRQGRKVKSYTDIYAALWLQKEGFLASFLQKLLNTMSLGSKIEKKGAGKFDILTDFTGSMKQWLEKPVDHLIDFDSLVMTHSNVNKNVAELNARVIGLDISNVNFGRLDNLLKERNNIAHGGLITYPNEAFIQDLLIYTSKLIDDFHNAVMIWLTKN